MHLLAKQKIQELLTETGHQLNCDDLDAVNKLNDLAEKVAGSNDPVLLKVLDRPVRVGNITLRPLTIGSYIWMVDMVERAEQEKPHMATTVIAYAMAYSDKPDKLMAVWASSRPWFRLFMWAMRVRCSVSSLERGIKKILPSCEYDVESGEYEASTGESIESSYGSLLAFLCKEYGATPQYWMWEESVEVCNSYVTDRIEQHRREEKAAAKASSKTGHTKETVRDETFIHMKAFREAANNLRDKWLTTK